MTYDLTGTGLTYKTASNLAVFATNSDEDIERCARKLGIDLEYEFVLVNNPLS